MIVIAGRPVSKSERPLYAPLRAANEVPEADWLDILRLYDLTPAEEFAANVLGWITLAPIALMGGYFAGSWAVSFIGWLAGIV